MSQPSDMRARRALDILNAKPPKLPKGCTRSESAEVFKAWIDTDLPAYRKAAVLRWHPDRPDGDEATFILIDEAVKRLQRTDWIRFPGGADECPLCSVELLLRDNGEKANYCPECGCPQVPVIMADVCPTCGDKRLPKANFCMGCCHDFRARKRVDEAKTRHDESLLAARLAEWRATNR